jgi:hypothetical protein
MDEVEGFAEEPFAVGVVDEKTAVWRDAGGVSSIIRRLAWAAV